MKSILILGRQPALGLAELESLFGAAAVQPLGAGAALLEAELADINFARLGGSVKLCKLLNIIDSEIWQDAVKYLIDNVPAHTKYLPEGSKLQLGLSAYNFEVSARDVESAGLSLKKIIKASGQSVRLVPNKAASLNSAQVIHNSLTGPSGWELVLIKTKGQIYIGQTVQEQDIEAYAARDQARPKRDARVGMLPPKLAQIIINFTGANVGSTILDPFCGTGVVLQEALLMGYDVYGSDLEDRMISFSKTNLGWLKDRADISGQIRLETGDATKKQWQTGFTALASETYLGRPFSALPANQVLAAVMQDVDTIHRKFLRNLAAQTNSGFKLSLALPAWKQPSGFKHLKMLDSLEEIGYTRASFVHAKNDDLIYHREGQIVGRELVVLTRK